MKFLPFSITGLLLLLSLSEGLFARTWTDVKGRSIEGEMVKKGEGFCVVKLDKNEKEVKIPLKRLSDKDREFVENWEPAPLKSGEDLVGEKETDIDVYFEGEWPDLVKVDVTPEITEEKTDEGFVYESPNYRFISDAELKTSVVRRFAVLFEATREYMRSLPIGNSKAHQKTVKNLVYLFETKAAYFKAGGPSGSAGVYIPSKDVIMVPFGSLGLIKRNGGYSVDYKRTNKTLPHEITHQLTDDEFYTPGLSGWYSEGLAEYVAVTPYRSGKFSVRMVAKDVEQYVTDYSKDDNRGRALGTDITMPKFEKYMTMDYGSFTANGNFNYGCAALLVTYLFEYRGDGEGVEVVKFLKMIKSGTKPKDALEKVFGSYEELQEDFAKEWSRRGVNISFR